jgi:release factor glutamine methyltransferase
MSIGRRVDRYHPRAVTTAKELIREAERALKASDAVDHPHYGKERTDAEDILTHLLGHEARDGERIDDSTQARFRRLLARRVKGEPVAYLTGAATFGDLELEIRRGAFIPRQSSEFMAEQALRRLRGRRNPIHVDLATGIGPVALFVASALPKARVFGVDVSAKPLALARRNAARLRLRGVTFLRGDLFSPLPERLAGQVDVITIHPPYVPRGEMRILPEEIVRFEPKESLTDDSPKGDRILRRVAAQAPAWLQPGGWLLVEVSPDRAREVATILRRAGLRDVRSTKGPVPVSRVVVGRR